MDPPFNHLPLVFREYMREWFNEVPFFGHILSISLQHVPLSLQFASQRQDPVEQLPLSQHVLMPAISHSPTSPRHITPATSRLSQDEEELVGQEVSRGSFPVQWKLFNTGKVKATLWKLSP